MTTSAPSLPTPPAPRKRTHTAGSAAILLMLSSFGSGLLALVRIRYVNSLFGAGAAQDAYRAAFTLPDLLNTSSSAVPPPSPSSPSSTAIAKPATKKVATARSP